VLTLGSIRIGLIAVAGTLIAGCGGSGGLPSCDSFTSPRQTGTCTNIAFRGPQVYANLNQTLTLNTLAAKVDRISVVRTLLSGSRKVVAHGRFVVVTLTITNRTGESQQFDQAALDPALSDNGQVLLTAPNQADSSGASVYRENVAIERHSDANSCARRPDLRAGAAITCELVYGIDIDNESPISVKVAANIGAGALIVANFGEDGYLTEKQRGIIRLTA
jgi:hypothetical protein